MSKLSLGWHNITNSMPKSISDKISSANVDDGSVTYGTVEFDTAFNNPTGGSWITSPLSISSKPTYAPVDPTYLPVDAALSASMNQNTLSANLSAVPPLNQLVFLYGNEGNDLRFMNQIDINLGGSSYDTFQLSILENAATLGDANGNVEVIDFSGTFTGALTLSLTLTNIFEPFNMGIRLESTTNQSSMFELKCVVLRPPLKPGL